MWKRLHAPGRAHGWSSDLGGPTPSTSISRGRPVALGEHDPGDEGEPWLGCDQDA